MSQLESSTSENKHCVFMQSKYTVLFLTPHADYNGLNCVCVCVRHSYTDPQVSMDLLRAVLQPSFNDDIMAVFRKYQKVSGGGVV